jgi:copper chaperone CopZ
MKSIIIILSLFLSFAFVQSLFARTIEVKVHGMTCSFCVDSLERKFKKMASVSKVQVSLKMKKIRLETEKNLRQMSGRAP